MSKSYIIPVLLISILLLSSCSMGGGRMIIYDNSDKKADARMEQLLETNEKGDRDAFKAMFSKHALNEADDFNGGVEYLFGLFEGSVDSWKRDDFTYEGSKSHGKESIMLVSWYTVVTDKDKYMFFIIDYTKDTIDPDNAGLYALRVIKAKDKEEQFTYYEDMQIAGIYKPKE